MSSRSKFVFRFAKIQLDNLGEKKIPQFVYSVLLRLIVVVRILSKEAVPFVTSQRGRF